MEILALVQTLVTFVILAALFAAWAFYRAERRKCQAWARSMLATHAPALAPALAGGAAPEPPDPPAAPSAAVAAEDEDEFPEPDPEIVKICARWGFTAVAARNMPEKAPVLEFDTKRDGIERREVVYRPGPLAPMQVRLYLESMHAALDADRLRAHRELQATVAHLWEKRGAEDEQDEEPPPVSGPRAK